MNDIKSCCGSVSLEDEKNLRAVADYIHSHMGFAFNSEQLCKVAYMGKTKLKTKFKEYFGCSMREYILNARMTRAGQLLQETQKSIADIAQVVGYNRPESFSKQFQKRMGLLPRDYRKSKRES